jgi:hypothetical protein
MYASMFCKPALKAFQNKLKHQEVAAAHVSLNITPKTLPQVEFRFRMDESVLSSEQIQANHNRMDQLARDFRLGATELYLKVAREECDAYEKLMTKILNDFPKVNVSVANVDVRDGMNATDLQRNETRQQGQNIRLPATRLYTEYMKTSRKRVLLDSERDCLFLAERRVIETPFVAGPVRFENPPLRKDFTLQA